MSRIITSAPGWQAPLLKKKTAIASKVKDGVYKKDRHINEPAPTQQQASPQPPQN